MARHRRLRPLRCGRVPLLIAILASILWVTSGCSAVQEPQKVRVRFDPDSQLVSISAESTPRSAVLGALRAETGIEVRLPGVRDESITIRLDEAPIQVALAQLLPEGARYVIRPGSLEIAAPPRVRGEKSGPPEDRPGDLPTKDKERPQTRTPGLETKTPAELWRPPQVRQGPNAKPDAQAGVDIAPGEGPKRPLDVRLDRNAFRFSFRITAGGDLRVVDATSVEGGVRTSSIVRGPFIFVMRDASGDILHFGSFMDPLVVHSYREEDGRHDASRGEEGVFGIWVPADLVSQSGLLSISLEVFDASSVALPRHLDQESVRRVVEEAKQLAVMEGARLFEALAAEREGNE